MGSAPTATTCRARSSTGSGFSPDNAQGAAWLNLISSLTYSGDPQVPDAAVVTVLDDPRGPYGGYDPAIDGFTITGGVQADFAGNIDATNGMVNTPYGAAGALVTQGGGIYAHSNVRNLHVTDNVIRGNGGSYGGGIRVGTPYLEHRQHRARSSPATRSATTAAPTWPAASASSPAATATRSPTTRSAATTPRSTAER